MKRTILALTVAGLLGGALFGLSGCYATHASVGVGVEAGPPAPASYYYGYRDGHVFIDGHWVWTATGWQWYPGYWVAARPGYVYVQGYWDYWGGRYLYRPGLWARHRHGYVWLGGRWRTYNPRYRHYDYRRGTWVRHGSRGYRSPPPRDHRTYRARPGVRDHRDSGRSHRRAPSSRDHRSGRRR
jgi:WXXGXW repeat (2 copies)